MKTYLDICDVKNPQKQDEHSENWHECAAFQRLSFGRSRSGGRLLAMT